MELFPASASGVFEYIQPVIESSDYFILVLAGRYGSIDETTGKSFTEMEYDAAKAAGIPTLCFLHSDPFKKLPGEKIEQTLEGREKLDSFTAQVRAENLAKLWDEPQRLGLEVMSALLEAFQNHPRDGWTRASGVASIEAEKEISELKLQLSEFKRFTEKDGEFEEIKKIIVVSLVKYKNPASNILKDILYLLSNYIERKTEFHVYSFLSVDELNRKRYSGSLHKLLVSEGLLDNNTFEYFVTTPKGRRFLVYFNT